MSRCEPNQDAAGASPGDDCRSCKCEPCTDPGDASAWTHVCLSIDGIDNAFEASGLLRLYHPEVPALCPMPGKWGGTLPGECSEYECVVRIEAEDSPEWFQAEALVYRGGKLCGRHTLSFDRGINSGSSDLLLRSPKLCAGTALYEALAKAFGFRLPWGSLTGVRPVKLASCLIADGIAESEARDVLVTRTGMSLEKADLLLAVACNEQALLNSPPRSVSLYVGIPFCVSRCLYCSFPSYLIGRMGHLVPLYLEALEKELRFIGAWLEQTGFGLSTVYVGGGTPTSLSYTELQTLLSFMQAHLPMRIAREFTVEAGRPDTMDPHKLSCMRDAGVTRISINPQSMNDETLRRIGRGHTAAQVVTAFEQARKAGFDNINADLIAGLPAETEKEFLQTLQRMADLRPDSLTVHTLAVKRASRLHENIREGVAGVQTDDATVTRMVSDAAEHARNRGMEPYYLYRQKNILANLENIGYALPGRGCRYNVETMSEQQTILAVGAGGITKISHGGHNLERTFNVREPSHYIGRIEEMIERKRELLEKHFS